MKTGQKTKKVDMLARTTNYKKEREIIYYNAEEDSVLPWVVNSQSGGKAERCINGYAFKYNI